MWIAKYIGMMIARPKTIEANAKGIALISQNQHQQISKRKR